MSSTIGLIDIDGKLPNLALMKISAFYKALGAHVEFASRRHYDQVYISCLFPWNRHKCEQYLRAYPSAIIGGTGWDEQIRLPAEIEACRPDYDLYKPADVYTRLGKAGISTKRSKQLKAADIANMGIGFTTRGCPNNCGFCHVPRVEGPLHSVGEIQDIINPRSNIITLYDNNLTADPYCVDKLQEIRDRGLIVDISQGIDVRRLTDEKAKALSEVKHLRSLHYAWDLIKDEERVLAGIKLLQQHVKSWRHMCYVLVGFNTTYAEDMYRVQLLHELHITPYVMKYNNRSDDIRLNHFARWVNAKIYKVVPFEEYDPWVKVQRGTAEPARRCHGCSSVFAT